MPERSLRVDARLDAVHQVCEAVSTAAKAAGFGERAAYSIELAVCEAVENIVVHGYGGDSQETIQARIRSSPDELVVELTDSAPAFNPANVEPKPPRPAHDPPVGGLGLYIVQQAVDEIKYERRDGRNHLILRKRLPERAG